MLRATEISKSYNGRKVLEQVGLQLNPGEIVSVLGPSGCGKSTLLRILAGLERPDSGLVARDTRRIGYLYQQRELMPWRDVIGNLSLGLEFQKVPARVARKRALSILAKLGLQGAKHLYPNQLSGGMARRVALGQVMATVPELLYLDEPLTGLDVNGRQIVAQFIRQYVDSIEGAALVVTHSIEEAVFISNRVLIFSANPGRSRSEIVINDYNRDFAFTEILTKFSEINPQSCELQAVG